MNKIYESFQDAKEVNKVVIVCNLFKGLVSNADHEVSNVYMMFEGSGRGVIEVLCKLFLKALRKTAI
jgi:hypothetical protein